MSRALLLLCALLAMPSLALGKKVLIDAPKPLKAALEKQLKKTNALGTIELSADPTGGEVKGACLDQGAAAVITGRLAGGQYTVMVLNGADGSPLSTFKVKAPAGKKPVKLPKDAAASLKSGIAEAKPPAKEVAPKKVEPVEEPPKKVEPEPTPKKTAPVATTPPPPPRVDNPPPEVVAEPEPKSKAVKPTALRLAVGAGFFTRRFYYTDDLFGALSRYSLPAGAAPHIDLDLYPAAFVTAGAGANIGVLVNTGFSVGLSSSRTDPVSGEVIKYNSNALLIRASLTYRIVAGPVTINPLLGYSLQSFTISPGSDGSKPNVPNTAYSALRFGAQLGVHLAGPVSVQGLFAYQAMLSTGEIGSAAYFPRSKAGGLDASLAIPIEVTKNFELRATGTYNRVWFSMNPEPGDPYIAGGALDDSWAVTATAAFVL